MFSVALFYKVINHLFLDKFCLALSRADVSPWKISQGEEKLHFFLHSSYGQEKSSGQLHNSFHHLLSKGI